MVLGTYGVGARIERVRALMRQRGYDAVIIRDEANLRWLTGACGVFDYTGEYPHAAVIGHDETLLHTDSRYYNSFIEHLPQDSTWNVDMEQIAIPAWVARECARMKACTVAVEDDMQIAFYRNLQRSFEDEGVSVSLPLMHGDVQQLRAVKDEQELELMTIAQQVTDAAFEHMLGFIKPGMTEKQVRLELETFMFEHGADSLAFSSIVASGPNTANPHAIPTDRVIERGDFVLMDYGAGYHDYRSDMTRTVVMGEPSARQREIYDLVQRTHEACAAAIHAGVDGHEVYQLSRQIISEAGYGDYYGHGLGHGVGIDIHELPSMGRSSMVLEEGSVVTVEPGVYLPGFGGVRLEDYGVVRADGFKPFTRSPHDLQIIECS